MDNYIKNFTTINPSKNFERDKRIFLHVLDGKSFMEIGFLESISESIVRRAYYRIFYKLNRNFIEKVLKEKIINIEDESNYKIKLLFDKLEKCHSNILEIEKRINDNFNLDLIGKEELIKKHIVNVEHYSIEFPKLTHSIFQLLQNFENKLLHNEENLKKVLTFKEEVEKVLQLQNKIDKLIKFLKSN